ncbi:ATP-binding protein [Streptomyces chartreusis]|uniref:Sensor histidine kinase n=1 Tax=Streptomyces chartreusis TaxID=1969 RepID=A0A7H8TE93_STRCX|nr:ATP-binding protein [Streptomyces chartreusis]QKZ20360.1 sensor histidine kinase [Streptomyces chartreusis]
MFARTRLALTGWAGDQDIAATAVKELMLNAAHHVGTGEVSLILTVYEDQGLLIQVMDEDPHFKGFDEATATTEPTGLHRIKALGGEITWCLLEQRGKAVQVRLHPAPQ